MIVIWDKDCIKVLEILKEAYTLTLRARCTEGGMEGMFICVCGPNKSGEREVLWQELIDIGGL